MANLAYFSAIWKTKACQKQEIAQRLSFLCCLFLNLFNKVLEKSVDLATLLL